MKITNNGKEPDRLIGGTVPFAGRFEVHEMAIEGGVMKMREVKGLEIKPGETVELKPGGYHVMFMDLKSGLKEGQTVEGHAGVRKGRQGRCRISRRPDRRRRACRWSRRRAFASLMLSVIPDSRVSRALPE